MKAILLFAMLLMSNFMYAQCDNQRYLKKVFSDVNVQKNISYHGPKLGPGGNLTILDFDLYEPKDDTAALRPLVIMMHGGAFLKLPIVNKRSPDIVLLSEDLAKRGYVVISPEYRLEDNLFNLLNKDAMVKIVAASLFDVNELFCWLRDSYDNGNPYKIDLDRVFVGGVSAGAVIALQGLFLDRNEQLGEEFLGYANEVAALDGIDIQADVLDKKYCGAKILGGMSMSGALLDTSWIVNKPTGILFIHGTADPIIPYGYDYPFGFTTLPKLFGTEYLYDITKRKGLTVEADVYPGAGHVPIIGDLDLADLFGNEPIEFIFNDQRLDSAKEHTATFFYKMLGCSPSVGVHEQVYYGQLHMFPNPSDGTFFMDIPQGFVGKKVEIVLTDIIGKVVYQSIMNGTNRIQIAEPLANGLYGITVSFEGINEVYTGKIMVNR
ncbi:MAG: T9SS type A sorting domain-containing protein [Chitinophagales bacterium]|nr:T9SS type A sorting domain-containing protein [Chitinophagales bacterium]